MTTSGEIEKGNTNDDGAINRRRVLKGAVAAGVGVAAWSQPSIRQLGSTPAYALHTATTTPPTPISASTSLNANGSNPACTTATGFAAEWGNAGTPGEVLIDIPAQIKAACNTAANERIVVDVRGCVAGEGSAFVRDLTNSGGGTGISLKACGWCCQVSGIFVSTTGQSGPYTTRNARGICDPKIFDATPNPGSVGIFLKASIRCLPSKPGDCCPD